MKIIQGKDIHQHAKGGGPEKTPPSSPSEGTKPADTLISGLASESRDDTLPLFKPHGVWYFVTAALENKDDLFLHRPGFQLFPCAPIRKDLARLPTSPQQLHIPQIDGSTRMAGPGGC